MKGNLKPCGEGFKEVARVRETLGQIHALKIQIEERLSAIDLHALRLSAGLSQERAATIADVSTKTWFHWERHYQKPDEERIKRVCRHIEELLDKES